jgi:hypothetical protein
MTFQLSTSDTEYVRRTDCGVRFEPAFENFINNEIVHNTTPKQKIKG